MVKTIIIIAVIAWILQILLGYLQINKFTNAYQELSKKSDFIGVGRSKGRFKPKVIIIIALNKEYKVMDTIIMKGLTVFAKPKRLEILHGRIFSEINSTVLFPNQAKIQEAVNEALTIKN